MLVTKGQLHDAVRGLNEIMNSQRQRVVPQTGKYRLAKLHRVLEPAYFEIEKVRNKIVQEFGEEQFADPEKKHSLGWGVDDKGPKFVGYMDAWNLIRAESVDLPKVQVIPLASLGDDPKGLEAVEFRLIGEFITDNFEETAA